MGREGCPDPRFAASSRVLDFHLAKAFCQSSLHPGVARLLARLPPRRGVCRVRIYLPSDERYAPVVVCSEVAGNEGQSVTNAAEQIAAEVIRYNELAAPVWIEHYPPETTDGRAETFDLVTFGHHEVREITRGGGTRPEIGPPEWKRLDRASVEVLVGGKV